MKRFLESTALISIHALQNSAGLVLLVIIPICVLQFTPMGEELVNWIAPDNTGKATSALSPCQCKVKEGCLVSFKPSRGGNYNDGTSPSDYDSYGYYEGSKNTLPEQCYRPYTAANPSSILSTQ